MVQLLIKLIFVLNYTLKIWLHQGQYLLTSNTYEAEILSQLRQDISQTVFQISHS